MVCQPKVEAHVIESSFVIFNNQVIFDIRSFKKGIINVF